MAIQTESNYPDSLNTTDFLLEAHDSLRLRLAEEYSPGDTSITVEGDVVVYNRFPATGYLTLTEQCSAVDERAISFHYSSKAAVDAAAGIYSFSGLELVDGFTDVEKPEKITNVTQNVMNVHHNNIVDALVSIQEFVGKKGIIDEKPFGETMEGRINYLHQLVLQPKAWFEADKRIGLVPFDVIFEEKAFLVGEGCPVAPVVFEWDFGDQDCSTISFVSTDNPSNISCISQISVASVVPVNKINVTVLDIDGGSIKKTYTKPGKYDVKLTVRNKFGEDSVIFPGFITARIQAPEDATIQIDERANQKVTEGDPSDGPYTTLPSIRSVTDTFIDFSVKQGKNPATVTTEVPNGLSYAGEWLNTSGNAIDPIIEYTWELSDDLKHGNSYSTRASYSIGGLYDLILRTDTAYGSYRITTYENAIDIIERSNLWLWTFISSTDVMANEFGIVGETFKSAQSQLTVTRNETFLHPEDNSEQLIAEFNRNTHFATTSINSGTGGSAFLYWAGGRSAAASPASEKIHVRQFNGFDDTYVVPSTNPEISRPWNWAAMSFNGKTYFILGNVTDTIAPYTSPTNLEKLEHNLTSFTVTATTFINTDFKNGADELKENVASYDATGQPEYGHFSAYRTTQKSTTGYLARNDGVGAFFRIINFYATEGIFAEPFQHISKRPDIVGSTKLEGRLAPLTGGIYFFQNSGAIARFDEVKGVWDSSGSNSTFSALQDKTVPGFSNIQQPLLVASDDDRRAYISFDYSVDSFIKFNEADLTFSKLPSRPEGDQWIMGVY